MSRQFPSTPERHETWFNRFHNIDDKKLAKELGAKPRNYEKQKKQFSDLMQWFQDNLIAQKEETFTILSEVSLIDILIAKLEKIEDLYLLPLFACDSKGVSELAWKAFMHFYLVQYLQENLRSKYDFLKSVTKDNLYSKITEERDKELKMIFGALLGDDILNGKFGDDNKDLLFKIHDLEKEYAQLKAINQKKTDTVSRKVWEEKGLLVTALFIDNIICQEDPSHDIPYLDEFLCYFDSIFFQTFMTESVFKNIPLVQNWITARSELLADTSSETYKLFCRVFFLGEEGLFDANGNITLMASLSIPHEYDESLGLVERRRKDLLARQEREGKQKKLEETTKKRIEDIITQKISVTCSKDFLLSLPNIPPEIEEITLTIQRNGKGYARTRVMRPFGSTINLQECYFETFQPTHRLNQPWSTVENWKGGNTYEVLLQGRIGTQNTPEQSIFLWTQKKILKNPGKVPPALPNIDHVKTHTIKRVTTCIQGPQDTPAPLPLPIARDPSEIEKEDLHTAIELLLESYNSDQELEEMFTENALFDEEKQVLALRIPMEELSELYVPTLLHSGEYGAMTQWTAKIIPGGWEYGPHLPPIAIQRNFDTVLRRIKSRKQKDLYDNELTGIGFAVSENNNNTALKNSVISQSINHIVLSKRIDDISSKFPRINGKTEYKLYTGQIIGGVIQSYSLVKNKVWSATIRLVPHLHFEFKVGGNIHEEKHRDLLASRIENALLTVLYDCVKRKKTGIASIVDQTQTLEDSRKLRNSYRRELKKQKARILVEHEDGTFEVVTNIGLDSLDNVVGELQGKHGAEKIALLYRRNTYAFVGDNSICKPSNQRSNEDYVSLNLPERGEILRERVIKTLFNENSGVVDRAAFIYGSAVYHALKQEEVALMVSAGKENLSREDIDDTFKESFIARLQTNNVLISYRDFCAGWVEDLTELDGEVGSPE